MAAPDDDPLGAVVESFLDRFRRGERPALTELMAQHPELAGQIRELIPALVELEQHGELGERPQVIHRQIGEISVVLDGGPVARAIGRLSHCPAHRRRRHGGCLRGRARIA